MCWYLHESKKKKKKKKNLSHLDILMPVLFLCVCVFIVHNSSWVSKTRLNNKIKAIKTLFSLRQMTSSSCEGDELLNPSLPSFYQYHQPLTQQEKKIPVPEIKIVHPTRVVDVDGSVCLSLQ
jgi:hypothetical protein